MCGISNKRPYQQPLAAGRKSESCVMKKNADVELRSRATTERSGAVTVEYLLLVTLVGIGVLVGLAAVRNALVEELDDVAAAINAIV